jgi:hypothetical protein
MNALQGFGTRYYLFTLGPKNYFPTPPFNATTNSTNLGDGYADMTDACWVAVAGGCIACFLLVFFKTEYKRRNVSLFINQNLI